MARVATAAARDAKRRSFVRASFVLTVLGGDATAIGEFAGDSRDGRLFEDNQRARVRR